jgi:hypothetical protein
MDQTLQKFGGRQLQKFCWVNAAALFAKEWPFKVDAENLCTRAVGFVLRANVAGNTFDGSASIVGIGGDSSRQNGSGTELSELCGYSAKSIFVAFHDVAAARAVNVHVNKAGNRGGVLRADFLRAGGESEIRAGSDGFDFAVANENTGARNFSFWSDGFADVQKGCGHSPFVS